MKMLSGPGTFSVVVVLFIMLSPALGAEPINQVPLSEPQTYPGIMPSLLSDREFILSLVALVFGTVVLIIEYKLLTRANAEGEQILKVLIVSTIVIATMFIISAGYTSEQIAPAIGLFGTIAGYLLGRSDKKLFGKQNDEEK